MINAYSINIAKLKERRNQDKKGGESKIYPNLLTYTTKRKI